MCRIPKSGQSGGKDTNSLRNPPSGSPDSLAKTRPETIRTKRLPIGPTTKKRLGKSPHAGLPNRTERCHRGSSPSLPEMETTDSIFSVRSGKTVSHERTESPLQHPLRNRSTRPIPEGIPSNKQTCRLPRFRKAKGRPREPRPTRPRTAFRKCSKDCGRRIRHRFSSRKGKTCWPESTVTGTRPALGHKGESMYRRKPPAPYGEPS